MNHLCSLPNHYDVAIFGICKYKNGTVHNMGTYGTVHTGMTSGHVVKAFNC